MIILTLSLAACLARPQPARAADNSDRMTWWREARFGMFIHWGLYTIPAGEWDGDTRHAEWIRHTAQIPIDRYDELAGQFNPVKFDADAWVRMAKDAGMRYIVITSKHHDGFCLFDSAHTDYDIMSTPFQRDIMKELADACRRAGLRICWYHSIMDWHHPDYLPRRGWEQRSAEGADLDRYVRHLHDQVTELLTNYGPVGVMWFDGEWEATWNHDYGKALYEHCRRLQPDLIVNNRVDKGRAGMAGMTTDGRYVGDFGTPEQEVPATGVPGVDWESCITMNDHWGFNKHDDNWKSSGELIRMLIDIASKGGNLLLNVGPRADGTFPDPAVQRLRDIGKWMSVNGEAIHGTTAGPFEHLPWGRCTTRRDGRSTRLYLHVFDWPADGHLVLPRLGNELQRAFLLTAPQQPLALEAAGGEVRIALPADAPDPVSSTVVLELAGTPVVYQTPKIDAAAHIFVRPLTVALSTSSDVLVIRYTLDGSNPNDASPVYAAPLRLSETTVVRAQSWHRGKAVSGLAEATFTQVEPLPAVANEGTADGGLPAGLQCDLYQGKWDRLPDFDALQATETRVVADIGLHAARGAEFFGRRMSGYIMVPRDDVYVFALNSDDGSRLRVHDRVVVDNDGLHGPLEAQGHLPLAAGLHPITIEYFNMTGGAALDLRYAPLGETPQRVPASALRRNP